MAIYHFSGTIISRSQGRSAVACAAYRSAELLQDDRYGKTHDYTKKQDVAHTEILLPENAPAWMGEREKLWNTVEQIEKRKDAQLAREFNFALPRELTLEQNIKLARAFVQQEFVSRGMVADLCIHNDRQPDGQLQPHAHVMLTLREVTPEGFGQKVREWNAKENLLQWREAWAEVANRHLFLHGHAIQIDHRTLKAQGIDLEPQHKIGAVVAQAKLARLADHQRIARENGEKLLADPTIALNALTRQQSTFSHQDLARFVHRHTETPEQFQQVYDTIKRHENLIYLGQDEKLRERFTSREQLALESQMLTTAKALSEQPTHAVTDTHQTRALASRALSEEQTLAFSHLTQPESLSCLIGYAGTGKSYLLAAAREAWEGAGYSVLGATLSGIAAENLEASSGIASRTLASHFYAWDQGKRQLNANTVLVVDEAGMLGSRQMARLLHEVKQHQAKLVLVGDPEQLQAIEAGAAFRAIAEQTGTVALTEIRRQQEAWQKTATYEFATGKTDQALARYAHHQHVHAYETSTIAKQNLIALWNDARLSQPDKTQIMLAYTRQDVHDLNQSARALRQQQQELGESQAIQTHQGERLFAPHDRIYFLKNDTQLGVKNGTLGTVQAIQGTSLTVRLDHDEREPTKPPRHVVVDTRQYDQVDYGYAATIHKAQGVTIDRSYLLASPYLDRHATYVAASRHRESCDIFYGQDQFADNQALARSLSRERSKDVTWDYLVASDKANAPELAQIQPIASATPETQRYEQFLAQAAKAYDRMANPSPTLSDDFSTFKTQFEQQNPEQARTIQEVVRPPHERLALEAEKQLAALEKAVQDSPLPRTAKKQLESYAVGLAKQTDVMNYLKQHNPTLTNKIQGWVKNHQLNRERDIGGRSL